MADETLTDDRLGMTEAQWAVFQKYTQGYGDQDENGIDLSLLRANLQRTPTQRWQRHQQALISLMELSDAGQRARLRANPRNAR